MYKSGSRLVKLGNIINPDWGEVTVNSDLIIIHPTSPQVINHYPQEIPARIENQPSIKINQYNI